MTTVLSIVQIVVAIVLIIAILLQNQATSLGGVFGGSDSPDTGFHTRRGFEKTLFYTTIIFGIIFVILTVISFIY